MNTQWHTTLALELAVAKGANRTWFDELEDSRLHAGACDRATAERLAAHAPSTFLSGWVAAMVPEILMQQR